MFVGRTLRLDTMIGDADFGKTDKSDKTFGFLKHDLLALVSQEGCEAMTKTSRSEASAVVVTIAVGESYFFN